MTSADLFLSVQPGRGASRLARQSREPDRGQTLVGPYCRLAAYHKSNCIEGSTKSWLKQPTLMQHTSTSSSTP